MIKPLSGVKVVEFEGIGPGPLGARMLADFGAVVTVIARPGPAVINERLGKASSDNPLRRGKHLVELNLKDAADVQRALAIVAQSDVLVEGNRPGVMERLGLGPAVCAALNPALVYARMTGWGQDGPLAHAAGHDINYVAMSGALALSTRPGERPIIPPTVLGDAGGALALAFGIAAALLQARQTGQGCVVDAAIVDTMASLGGLAQWVTANGGLGGPAPSAFHDSPFYDVYTCSDGLHVSIGALEPQFYALLLEKLGWSDVDAASQYDTTQWPALKARLSAQIASQPRAHWVALMEGSDVCFGAVLSLTEAAQHPHNVARGNFLPDSLGGIQTAASPRFLPFSPA
jgi:alpha-methylacyl-CoA racemase